MEPKAALSLTESQLAILIDCIHDRFMAVSDGREPMPPASRTVMLDTLSRLHAAVQLAADAAVAQRGSKGQA